MVVAGRTYSNSALVVRSIASARRISLKGPRGVGAVGAIGGDAEACSTGIVTAEADIIGSARVVVRCIARASVVGSRVIYPMSGCDVLTACAVGGCALAR